MSLDIESAAQLDLDALASEPMLVLDPASIRNLIEERRKIGADRFDEVWEGQYRMSPSPSNRHYRVADAIYRVLAEFFDGTKTIVQTGGSVSDRRREWAKNFRVPDVLVVMPGGKAIDCGEFYHGGPDFVVEIVSPGERPHDKLPFYASIGVREALLIDRDTLELELFRLDGERITSQGRSTQTESLPIASVVMPLTWSTTTRNDRPALRIHCDAQTFERWISP
ncbi:MAG: Uma2 family endonuclease [Pirellulales bacterium]